MIWSKGTVRVRTSDVRSGEDSSAGLEDSLLQLLGHHQVSTMLTDVANLKGRIGSDLALDRQVPLLSDGRLNRCVPGVYGCVGERVAPYHRAGCRTGFRAERSSCGCVKCLGLRRIVGGVLCQP